MKEYLALFKIGKLGHLQALRDDGQLYCNTLKFFIECEDKIQRGDELEGVTTILNLNGGTFNMKDVGAPDSAYSKPMNIDLGKMMHSDDDFRGNIFCLYSIGVDQNELGKDHYITEEIKAFGDYFLVIKNYREFIRRVSVRLEELEMTGNFGFITYKDFGSFSGKKTHFQKDFAFKRQKEFRIFINSQSNKILNFRIGSIADISEIGCCIDLDAINFYDIG